MPTTTQDDPRRDLGAVRGRGPVLESWMKLRVKCGTCGLRLQRGEHDTIMGAAFILFTLVGVAGYAILTATMLATEATPWDIVEYGIPALAVVLLFALYPFAKLLWLAFHLMLRPVTPGELEWHRAADTEFSTERDAIRRRPAPWGGAG